MDEENNQKKEGLFSTLAKSGVKEAWNRAPITLKLKILGGLVIVLFAFIIIATFISYNPFNFLNFSNSATGSNNFNDIYSDYWIEACDENSENCTEEQKQAYEKLSKSQQKFFKRLDNLVKKYKLDNEQKYLILTTLFYNIDIDNFEEGSAYNLNEGEPEENIEIKPDDYNYENNVYEEEYDTLRELVKQFLTYTAMCKPDKRELENGETTTDADYALKDSNDKVYSFSFWEYVKYSFGANANLDGFKEAEDSCPGSIYYANKPITDKFYEYLLNSKYFDNRNNFKSYYISYAKLYDLDIDNLSSWSDEQLKDVRQNIIDDIKEIVSEFKEENNTGYIIAASSNQYWWPIGSVETTEVDGVLFAAGDPESVYVTSQFGMRDGRLHDGIDIGRVREAQTNIIASMSGEVIKIGNNCPATPSSSCNAGAGNFVNIRDLKGNVTSYRHLYPNSIIVSVGDKVKQGQVIGKAGNSGNSKGAHLHFNIKINGVSTNPLDYINPENPRPSSSVIIDFNNSAYTEEEFIAKMEKYYTKEGVCNGFKDGDCYSYQNEILNHSGARTIYEIATRSNINPEIYASRVIVEGYSPGTNYNYVGYSCYNTDTSACSSFPTFENAVQVFINNAAQYPSAEDMFARYAYLGDYWYTGIHWGLGGCGYAKYIYPDGIPDRVVEACSHPDGYCTKAGEPVCVPTTEEDHLAYKRYQLRKMINAINMIFG